MRAFLRVAFSAICLLEAGASRVVQADVDGDPISVTIDGVRIPYGTPIEIEGRCRPTTIDESFDSLNGPCIDGWFLNGRANLDRLSFHLHSRDRTGERPELAEGKWYRVRGPLTDGLPRAVHPVFRVAVESVVEIPAREHKFSDFADRKVTVEGTALAGGRMRLASGAADAADFVASLSGTDWPEQTVGKRVEVSGTVQSMGNRNVIESPLWKLVELKDQVGRQVELDGHVWSLNGNWWFKYRDEKVYLTTARGPALIVPGESHGRKVRIRGELVRQLRPPANDIGRRSGSPFVACHVVRNARVEFLEGETVWPEKFGHAYFVPPRIAEGVPELVQESGFIRNRVPGMSDAMYRGRRNWRQMEWILRDPSPQVRDVLSRRMNDEEVDPVHRLYYAAMLAAANDVRGHEFLLAGLKARDPETLADVLYCLGVVPKLLPEGSPLTTDMAWAEETFLSLLASDELVTIVATRNSQASPERLSTAAATYSDILARLLERKTDRTRAAVLAYVLRADRRFSLDIGFADPLQPVLESLPLFASDELHELLKIADIELKRASILNELLRRRDPAVVDLFLEKVNVHPFDMSFRDHAEKETLEAMQERAGRLTPEARRWIELLLVLREEDPIPGLLQRLEDPAWIDKNPLTRALANRPDARAVAPMARLLRTAPASEFPKARESTVTWSVNHGLEIIAEAGTREAIGELIALLSVDLARFPTAYSRAELQRMVAENLIEQTGESFGTDAAAWQKWFDANKESFP